MNVRIAFFLPDLHAGGAEKVILSVAKEINRRGYPIDLVIGTRHGALSLAVPEGIRTIDLGISPVSRSKLRFAAQTILRLHRYLRNQQPDCLLSTLTGANLAAVIALCMARRGATALLLREASSRHNIGNSLRKPLVRLLYPYADAYIAVSQGIADDLTASFGLKPEAVHLIHNPIDVQEIAKLASGTVDHRWLRDSTRPLIVAAGRLKREKGYEYLIHEFHLIRARTSANLLILGEGPERKHLANLIYDLGLSSRVELPGYLDNPFPLIAHARLFVLSSQWEGFPNVLLQALALGVPIVSTDCHSGPAEILNFGEFGRLVPYGRSGALSEAILDSLAEPTNRSALRARASCFSLSDIVDKYEAMIAELVRTRTISI